MMGEPVIAYGSVVALDVSILLRLPGWMKSMRMPRFAAHPKVTALMYSEPLSQRMASGFPRHR
jgi:hypothetical protein